MKHAFLGLGLLWLLQGCASHYSQGNFALPAGQNVALMPLVNHSQTPLAGERAEDLLSSLWLQEGLPALITYPRSAAIENGLPDLDDQKRFERMRQWLAAQPVIYYVTGSVEEWHYKSGLDAEPTVGVTLKIYRKQDDQLVWSVTGARAGWDRESLTTNAQRVLQRMVSDVELVSE